MLSPEPVFWMHIVPPSPPELIAKDVNLAIGLLVPMPTLPLSLIVSLAPTLAAPPAPLPESAPV